VSAPSDRRFRRPDVRPGRRKRARHVVRRIVRLGVPLLVGVVVVGWAGSAVLESSLLRVTEVVVRGGQYVDAADVKTVVDGIHGQNILTIDVDEHRQQLMASPWVADVSLWRVLPSTIEVRLVERTPMAVARFGPTLFLVDAAGVVIDAFGPAYHDFDLPIVDGLLRASPDGRPAADPERVVLARALLHSLETTPDLLDRLSQIDVAGAHDAVVLLNDDPAWLHLGHEEFVERLSRYIEYADELRERIGPLDSVDMRFGQRIIVGRGGKNTEWSRE
jgi:cell division septal protein FtsQ